MADVTFTTKFSRDDKVICRSINPRKPATITRVKVFWQDGNKNIFYAISYPEPSNIWGSREYWIEELYLEKYDEQKNTK